MNLTIERLNLEYIAWSTQYGNGRDDNDLRFGQAMHNKYSVPNRIDIFYVESSEKAYLEMLQDLLMPPLSILTYLVMWIAVPKYKTSNKK